MKRTERGNILFLILLAVVLFAALSYAVTQSMRGGGNDVSREKGEADAAALMNYFSEMDTAIKRMMLTGNVRDYELNFYYSTAHNFLYGAFDNTNCTESRCRVFDPAGGNVTGRHLDSYTRGNWQVQERIYYASVNGAGTSAPDIVFGLHGVKHEICKAINRKLGVDDIIYGAKIVGDSSSLMYQFAIPVGPIPSSTVSSTGVSFSVGNIGTFCTCINATQAECEASQFSPAIFHVLVAR